MMTIKTHTVFGEVVREFNNQKDAMEWIELHLANKVPFEVYGFSM